MFYLQTLTVFNENIVFKDEHNLFGESELMEQYFINWIEYFLEHGGLGLFLMSFIESSFFPIPPDLVLIPLVLHSSNKALCYALLCSLGSVLGAILGYYIGWKVGCPALCRIASPDTIKKVDRIFEKWGGWGVAIAGFTPIPYKVFTIASGVFRLSLKTLLIASIIARSLRFFTISFAVAIFGNNMVELIKNYFEIFSIILVIIVISVYFLVTLWYKKAKNKRI